MSFLKSTYDESPGKSDQEQYVHDIARKGNDYDGKKISTLPAWAGSRAMPKGQLSNSKAQANYHLVGGYRPGQTDSPRDTKPHPRPKIYRCRKTRC
eukprot:scaffold17670_cov118-Amphora_coffeaeformis.AAC.2